MGYHHFEGKIGHFTRGSCVNPLSQRITEEYLPGMTKRRAAELERQGIKNNDYWHLELLFTNPDDEGHGS